VENDTIQALPLIARADHDDMQLSAPLDVRQLNATAGQNIMNSVCVETTAVNGSHAMSAAGQSLSDTADRIKSSPRVVQSVYSLPIQQPVKCDGWENCAVTLPL